MEENQNQGSSLFEMEIDSYTQTHLNTISKWSKFIAITGFVCIGLFILALLMAGTKIFQSMNELIPTGASDVLWVVIVIIIIAGGLCAAWLYFLLQSSTLIKKALYGRNSADLAEGFKALRTYFTLSIVISVLSLVSTLYTMINI